MAKKTNGKAQALVVERPVDLVSERIWQTLALRPPEVRTTSDVLELLEETARVLFLLRGDALGANRELAELLILDARNRVQASVEALRTGRFPTFNDERCREPMEWVQAAHAILAGDDDESWIPAAAAELFLSLAQDRSGAADAREAAR